MKQSEYMSIINKLFNKHIEQTNTFLIVIAITTTERAI